MDAEDDKHEGGRESVCSDTGGDLPGVDTNLFPLLSFKRKPKKNLMLKLKTHLVSKKISIYGTRKNCLKMRVRIRLFYELNCRIEQAKSKSQTKS